MALIRVDRWIALILLLFWANVGSCDEILIRQLSEDNWAEVLEGEWLVKFYAPWCPACRAMASAWESMAEQVRELNVKVAEIDVTNNPALSGRFFVTALPTIYHVKDGVFRPYTLARSEKHFFDFIAQSQWQDVDPVPWYFSPTSFHMSFLGTFFRFSIGIKDLHSTIMTEFGIPVWASYALFALATIVFGLLIGLFIVCLCDLQRSEQIDLQRSEQMSEKRPSVNDNNDTGKDNSSSDLDHSKDNSNDKNTREQNDNSEFTLRQRETKSADDT